VKWGAEGNREECRQAKILERRGIEDMEMGTGMVSALQSSYLRLQ
jgi:hypothetical protein